MNNFDQAVEIQLESIRTKTGRTLNELGIIVEQNGFHEHDEIRDMFHREMGLPYGEANLLAHAILQSAEASTAKRINEMDDELIAWISLAYENAA